LETLQHQLQQFDPGIVWLDTHNRITAMNGVALKTLGDRRGDLIGEEVLQLHPEKSRDKVRWLLDKSSCPMDSPPPMTMMINIPERVLMIKVARMCGQEGDVGTCMVFYDLTDLTTTPSRPEPARQATRNEERLQLYKLPVHKDKRTLLVDLDAVCCIKAEGHYSNLYTEDDVYLCNLSLSDLEGRLDERVFFRMHRSYIVNMRYAKAFEKSDDQCNLVLDHGDGLSIPISRSNISKVKKLLGLD
jgi:DNA-binding LytR/AlgR family response regulator